MKKGRLFFLLTGVLFLFSFKSFAGGWRFELKYAHHYHVDSAYSSYNFISLDSSIVIGSNETLLLKAAMLYAGGQPPGLGVVQWKKDGIIISPVYMSSDGYTAYFTLTDPGVYEASISFAISEYKKFTVIQSVTSSISDKDVNEPLLSIYPNPYSVTTQISYSLDKRSNVVMEVYNSVGQKIETLVKATQDQGEYNYPFNASEKQLEEGIYFVKMTVNGKTTMKRIVKTK